MQPIAVSRRTAICLGTALAISLIAGPAGAADKVSFLTSWFAQAEHGGFYQAKATGLYEKEGLDVTIKMGGPQVNGMQLLLGGETDMMIGYDFQVLNGVSKGLPVITVGTSFQKDLQGIMTHADVKDLGDLKDRTILIASSGRTSWWPFVKLMSDLWKMAAHWKGACRFCQSLLFRFNDSTAYSM